ncbi:MAG: thrombospondin type 3 repeat-containing protein, partial [Dehalococcoidia bacterium]|nr:thrombospondin type 3 repeat-containing protein [Dehalococcoidia bacterium]
NPQDPDCDQKTLAKWLAKANEVWAQANIEFVHEGKPDIVQAVGDGKVEGAINIYCTNRQAGSSRANPGWTHNPQQYIEIGKTNAADDSLAHELGHWMDAIPDGTGGEHGNVIPAPPAPTPGPHPTPGILGLDTDGDGDDDADDKKNIMYAGIKRSGSQVDDPQKKRGRENIDDWRKKEAKKEAGGGEEKKDAEGEATSPIADVAFDEKYFWPTGAEDRLVLAVTVTEVSGSASSWLGFRIDSDNSTSTGDPSDGADYRVAYNPFLDELRLEQYSGAWSTVSPTGITVETLLEELGDPLTVPAVLGYSFDVPLSTIGVSGSGVDVAARAFASTPGIDDTSDLSDMQPFTRPTSSDKDNDGVPDYRDNCVTVANAGQLDTDGGGTGDACDLDDDDDGCTDAAELGPKSTAPGGGGRDPLNFWDFYDVPDPNARIWRDGVVALFTDIFGVAGRFGATGDPGTDPRWLVPPKAPGYHPAFDRSEGPGPNPWNMGPADGTIDLFIDIFGVAFQFGHDCG